MNGFGCFMFCLLSVICPPIPLIYLIVRLYTSDKASRDRHC